MSRVTSSRSTCPGTADLIGNSTTTLDSSGEPTVLPKMVMPVGFWRLRVLSSISAWS